MSPAHMESAEGCDRMRTVHASLSASSAIFSKISNSLPAFQTTIAAVRDVRAETLLSFDFELARRQAYPIS